MLAKNTQRFVLYTAFAQSILLLIMHELMDRDIWPSTSIPFRVLWYTLVLALPTAVCLLLREVRDRRFWILLSIYGVLIAPLAWHTGTQYVPDHHVTMINIFFPYVLGQIAIWFIATFFIEAAQDGGDFWHTPVNVCSYAWRNFLTLGLLGLFLGALLLVLLLWGSLFKLLNIEFFWYLFFDSHRFAYPFFGVAGGIGVLILRNQANVVSLMEKIAGALLRILLPLVAFIAILFLATLPFTGMQLLWKTGEGTFLMMWLVCLMLLLVNVTYQHERDFYQRFLEIVIRVIFLLLPVYLGICAWGISLRVDQYGWSFERLWTVAILFMQACFVLSYAAAMYLPGKSWIERLPELNKRLGLLAGVVLVLLNTPLLDPHRIAAADQVARLSSGKTSLDKFDYRYLRFELGEYGYQQTLQLKSLPEIAKDPERLAYLQKLLDSATPWMQMNRMAGQNDMAAAIEVLPKGKTVPAGLMAMVEKLPDAPICTTLPSAHCKLIAADVSGGGLPEYVFVGYNACTVKVAQDAGSGWRWIGEMRGRGCTGNLVQALSTGQFKLVKPVYQDIQIDGARYQLVPLNESY